jgi:DNA (cytosine-5)-methyltransferase 1
LLSRKHRFSVIDLFAGPGGLSEGFSSYQDADGDGRFKIALSVEVDRAAHRTLELRAFLRRLNEGNASADYSRYVRGEITREELFDLHSELASAARAETWRFRLGREPQKVDGKIREALADATGPWILIGGPPCVAYSVAGRAHYRDGRRRWRKQQLYQHYLRVIAKFAPAAFVMENVKGLLSSKVRSESVFEQILQDLRDPEKATAGEHTRWDLNGHSTNTTNNPLQRQYRIFSFVRRSLVPDDTDFVIRAEEYGIPQRRHRVILLGVRSDLDIEPGLLSPEREPVTTKDLLGSLPALRSRLSNGNDSPDNWADALREGLLRGVFDGTDDGTFLRIVAAMEKAGTRTLIGDRFLPGNFPPKRLAKELFRENFGGVSNHESRSHMKEDLWRYVFVAAYGQEHGRSPVLKVFPKALLPSHESVVQALGRGHGYFSDRFRVQIASKPATTVTSHISKDGHYFIHYDPSQCRSLTVREAARLQTFPDDYFFEGNRTEQYSQVGNAVPPLLARQLAAILHPVLDAALDKSYFGAKKQAMSLNV